MEKEKLVEFNGQKIPESSLEEKKKEAEEKKQKVVEVKPGKFRTKLEEAV